MWRKELNPKCLNSFPPKVDTDHGIWIRNLSISSSLQILENTFYTLRSLLLDVKIKFSFILVVRASLKILEMACDHFTGSFIKLKRKIKRLMSHAFLYDNNSFESYII